METATEIWDDLDPAWRLCVEQAWASWVAGSAGVGAVILDASGEVVSVGRNRMMDQPTEPGILAGNRLAHAEMNALTALPLTSVGHYTLYTSFEPCLMCASAILQSRIAKVAYAAADPVFEGLHDWLSELAFAADRMPEREHLGGPVGVFAHVLHLSWLAFWIPEGPVIDAHQRLAPSHLDLARDINTEGMLSAVARAGGTPVDALDALWDRLVDLGRATPGLRSAEREAEPWPSEQ
jgi:tRNA(Arg) A34 adenosine deaminase TadA